MAARITDPTTHGAPLAPGPGSTDVLIGSLPAWRTLIDQHACPAVSVSGADGVGMVMMGSPTVLIDFQMSCRQLDIVVEVPGLAMGPANPILMGCPTVIIGEAGMGGMGSPMASALVAAKAAGVSVVPVSTSTAGSAVSAGSSPGTTVNPAPQLTGVTPSEVQLAASPGIGASQIAAREKVAQAFYTQQAGMEEAAAEAHISGIDLHQPVIAATSPPPETLTQWHAPGATGRYFSNPGTKPADLGIGNFCLDPKTRQITGKSVDTFAVKPGTAYLQSTAKKVVDTWSVPLNNACPSPLKQFGLPQMTKGGATQYFIPAKNACTPKA